MATLPPDLQKIVRDDGAKVSEEIMPFVKEFFAKQQRCLEGQGRRADPACRRRSRPR